MAENKEYTTFNDCFSFSKFKDFGWESIYNKYIVSVIKILGTHNDVSRLYLLIQIELTNNDEEFIINELLNHKINPPSDAIQLTSNLKNMLPNADPIYLDLVGEVYASDHFGLTEYLDEISLKKKSYPKLRMYNEKVAILNTKNSLTINFKVDEFLRMCPDPENYFNNIKLDIGESHFHESLSYLADRYQYERSIYLIMTLQDFKYNLTKTVEALETDPSPKTMKKMRRFECDAKYVNFKNTTNISFLKELAYIEHKKEILDFIKNERSIYQKKISEAEANGQLRYCECCYNDKLLDSEVHCCPANHYFCSSCIKQGTEVALGNGKLDIKCFSDCDEELNLSIIKELIDDKLYQRVVRLRQVREVKAANIEGLESCAFCDFCIILPAEEKSIKCLNPECYKETCRLCRQESHFPIKCDEIEGNVERRFRTMVENKLNETLLRTCYSCKRTFMKVGGCNKMTCVCGKHMCFVCKAPLDRKYYTHFDLKDQTSKKCPLYTNTYITYTNAVNEALKLIIDDLEINDPEMLKKIDINQVLLDFNGMGIGSNRMSTANMSIAEHYFMY